MAIPLTCPSCGQPVTPPRGACGGTVGCPNPACGQRIEFAALSTQQGPDAARVPGSRPVLLDQLRPSLLTSPGILALGGVLVLIYGLVLFVVVSDMRRRSKTQEGERPTLAQASPTLPSRVVRPPTTPPRVGPRSTVPTAVNRPVETARSAAPRETEKPVQERPKGKQAVAEKPVDVPKPPVAPPPVLSKVETWGPLSGETGDCLLEVDGPILSINLPGVLHVLSPELNVRNAPRLLAPVNGDFTAQVSVSGRILPGTRPLPNLPFTYQGAGLLLWVDENNYLRLERSSRFVPLETKRYNQVMLELCRDGRTVPAVTRDVREVDLSLRMDRRGDEVRCSYSPDEGKTWLEIKRQPVSFPAEAKVGVSASNVSSKPFVTRLGAFSLTGPGVKARRDGSSEGERLADRP